MTTQQDLDELQDKLDLLIISYLDLFDEYQASRDEISRALSDGFFNLAQANFNAPNRVRYGQDMYDNRMQALRGVRIDVNEADVTTYNLKDLTVAEVVKSEKSEKPDSAAPSKLDDSDPEPTKEKSSEDAGPENSSPAKSQPSDSEAVLALANSKSDPLRWFGILRPMTLGNAQKNFTQSLPPIMKLVSTLDNIEYHEKRIRDVRQKVRVMRRELGINLEDDPVEVPVTMPELDKLSIDKNKVGNGTKLNDDAEGEKGPGGPEEIVQTTE
ncbi:hypothetical protein TWF730_001462 [Orbilia blumenaviensis]|uniref:Vacuolar ATPase assembly protein VMA22 n=1 Tax=Orbilia blumenaviensis TaxID=1796055 RepID=A0AAV9ULG6_9PEZI